MELNKTLSSLKFLFRHLKSILKTKIPEACEDIAVWSPSRKWPIFQIHDAFTLKLKIPTSISNDEILHSRFLINHNLGFSAQFMVNIPNVTITSSPGFFQLDEGAYLAQGNWRVMNVVAHPTMYSNFSSETEELTGNWYAIRSYYSHSYHHWFWDDLPRLLTAIPHLPVDINFLVGEPFHEFQKKSLLALGIDADKIKIQSVKKNVKIEQLWFATPLGHSEYAATAPDVAKQLQALFQPSSPVAAFRKIYISRALAKYRRLVNESELIPILKNLGFEIIYAEQLSFEAQVKLFNEAKVILSPHGAGLTNMLFAPSSALILELFEPTAARTHYWMMAYALGHNYDCLVGETVMIQDSRKSDPDFKIDLCELKKFIEYNLRLNLQHY